MAALEGRRHGQKLDTVRRRRQHRGCALAGCRPQVQRRRRRRDQHVAARAGPGNGRRRLLKGPQAAQLAALAVQHVYVAAAGRAGVQA